MLCVFVGLGLNIDTSIVTIDASDDNMRYQMNNVADNLNIKKINMPIPHLGWNLTHTTDSTENGGIIIQDVGEITIQKLKEFEIPYHGVTFWQTICKFLYR